jgi:hypothetical protein
MLALAGSAAGSTPVQAQAPVQDLSRGESSLRVFLDCATWNCREDRIRQDLTWVTWVREPQDAQLFIIVTGQRAGGGFQYAFDFEGRGPLAELNDRYLFTSSSTDVEEEVVQGLLQTLSLGLVRFVALGGFENAVEIRGVATPQLTERDLAQEEEEDPWDYWVFGIDGNVELDEEDRESQEQFRLGLSANRTTDAWKIDLGGNINFFRRSVTFEDGGGFTDNRDDWSTAALVVRSLSDHWSVGLRASSSSFVRLNRDLAVGVAPAIEWNYFPWQEATRRRFVVLYNIGLEYLDYDERTVFERETETLWEHRLDVQFRTQEAWGSARLGTEVQQFLEFRDQYSFQVNGRVDYRIVRGLGVNLQANYEIIRNQRFLSGGGLTPEEILTSRRALATGSRFQLEMGVSFRFGSIFNNIVNARFPGLGGGGR